MSQQGTGSSSGAGAGALPGRTSTFQGLRSDATKPSARPSSNSRGTTITRQPSGGQPGARSGRSSIGAANSYSSRPASQGSTAANGSTSVLTSSAAAAAASVYAAAGSAPSAASRHASAAAATAAVGIPSSDSLTPAHQRATVRNNSLFGDESATMTPGVVNSAYSGRLTPQFAAAEEQHHAAAHHTPSSDSAAAGAAADSGAAGTGGSHRLNRYVKPASDGSITSSSIGFVPEKQPEPKHYLPTAGDLFTMPDQNVRHASDRWHSLLNETVHPSLPYAFVLSLQ